MKIDSAKTGKAETGNSAGEPGFLYKGQRYPDSYQPDIGKLIDTILRWKVQKGFSTKQFFSEHYAEVGCNSPAHAKHYLSNVRNGCIYGSSSSNSAAHKENVQRLSRLLYLLGVPEEHALIEKLDELEPERFDYPPE